MKLYYRYFLLIFGLVILANLIYINNEIYLDYQQAKGKNRALFGLTLLLSYGHRTWYGIAAIIGVLLSTINIIRNNEDNLPTLTSVIFLFAIILAFVNVWFWFI